MLSLVLHRFGMDLLKITASKHLVGKTVGNKSNLYELTFLTILYLKNREYSMKPDPMI